MGTFPAVDLAYDETLRAAGVAAEHWPDYRTWLRFYLHYPADSGDAGPQRRTDDDDPYAHHQVRPQAAEESLGLGVTQPQDVLTRGKWGPRGRRQDRPPPPCDGSGRAGRIACQACRG